MLDKLLQFSDNQVITVDAVSQNTIDLWPNGDAQSAYLADSADLCVAVYVSSAAVGTGTYTIQIQTDDNDAFSSPTVIGSATPTAAQLGAGKVFWFGLPQGLFERYVRLNYDTGGTSPGVTLDAFLTPVKTVSKYNKYYRSGTTITT